MTPELGAIEDIATFDPRGNEAPLVLLLSPEMRTEHLGAFPRRRNSFEWMALGRIGRRSDKCGYCQRCAIALGRDQQGSRGAQRDCYGWDCCPW